MQLIPLLGKPLKSDEVIDLLELWDVEVVYNFDRTHENQPDQYWAVIPTEGIQFLFDEYQNLKCIFLYVLASDAISPVDLSHTDIQAYKNCDEVAAYAAQKQLATSDGRADWQGVTRDWIRIESETHHIHYEFREGDLGLITLTRV